MSDEELPTGVAVLALLSAETDYRDAEGALVGHGWTPRGVGDWASIDGIASERDVVKAIAEQGAAVLSEPVTSVYTAEVHTATPETQIDELMQLMTDERSGTCRSSPTALCTESSASATSSKAA